MCCTFPVQHAAAYKELWTCRSLPLRLLEASNRLSSCIDDNLQDLQGTYDVAHSYLLEPTRPAKTFRCTCQNIT